MRRAVIGATVAAAALLTASGANALNCGASSQPKCVEAPPPGVVLRLDANENPFGLRALSAAPSADQPLWPRVRGHKPYGFNAVAAGRHGTTPADEAFLHQQLGASLARLPADWAMIQYYPSWSAGGQPWLYEGYLDPAYRALVARGVRPILSIQRTPRRFTRNADTPANSYVVGCGWSDACWNPPRATEVDRIAAFAADLARRYPLAAGIELWNEPNMSNPFWGGETPDPEHFAVLLDAVHDAVRRVRPRLPVIAGGLAPFVADRVDRWGNEEMSLRTFTRRLLQSGAQDDMDAISFHPYLGPFPHWTSDPGVQWVVLTTAMTTAPSSIQSAYADAGKAVLERMVVSEYGVSTTYGFTPEQQSDWLQWQYLLTDVAHPKLPLAERTDAMLAHLAVEDPEPLYGNIWQSGFGWVRVKDGDGQFATKPVYCAFRTRWGGFVDCPVTLAP